MMLAIHPSTLVLAALANHGVSSFKIHSAAAALSEHAAQRKVPRWAFAQTVGDLAALEVKKHEAGVAPLSAADWGASVTPPLRTSNEPNAGSKENTDFMTIVACRLA
jgi:hypothetical protein